MLIVSSSVCRPGPCPATAPGRLINWGYSSTGLPLVNSHRCSDIHAASGLVRNSPQTTASWQSFAREVAFCLYVSLDKISLSNELCHNSKSIHEEKSCRTMLFLT